MNEDLALGRKAVDTTIRYLSYAMQIGVLIYTPWYAGVLLSLLIAIITWVLSVYVQVVMSDEAFESYGRKVGSALGSVRNLFTRKAA